MCCVSQLPMPAIICRGCHVFRDLTVRAYGSVHCTVWEQQHTCGREASAGYHEGRLTEVLLQPAGGRRRLAAHSLIAYSPSRFLFKCSKPRTTYAVCTAVSSTTQVLSCFTPPCNIRVAASHDFHPLLTCLFIFCTPTGSF